MMTEDEKTILVLEIRDTQLCESEPKEWVKIGKVPQAKNIGEQYWKQYFKKSVQDAISDALTNGEYEVPISLTLKKVSKKEWIAALKEGDRLK